MLSWMKRTGRGEMNIVMGPSTLKFKSVIAIIQRFMMRIFRRVDNAKEIVALQDARNGPLL